MHVDAEDHPTKEGSKVLDCTGRLVKVHSLVDLSNMSLVDRLKFAGAAVGKDGALEFATKWN